MEFGEYLLFYLKMGLIRFREVEWLVLGYIVRFRLRGFFKGGLFGFFNFYFICLDLLLVSFFIFGEY